MSGRFDHQLSTNHRAMARLLYEDFQQMGSFGGTNAYSYGREQSRTSLSILAQETAILSSKMVNDFRVQYRNTDVGWTPNSTDPTEVRPSGRFGAAEFLQQEKRHRYQFYDTLYFTTTNHNIKAGGEVTYMETSYCACGRQSGFFTFSTDADYDASNPVTWPIRFEQAINLSAIPLPDTYFGMFFQDDWRVTDRLTLNLGVRWDVDLRVRDNDTMERAFELARNQSLRPILSESPGKDLDNIDPRLGFAYSLSPATVIRGGYGIYHSRARMFMQALANDQLTSESFVAVVTDPQRLRNYPDINAILGGTPQEFAATGLRSMSNVIANDFQVPYAHNTTLGFTRQFGDVLALSVDGVYSKSLKYFQKRVANLPDSFSALNRAGTATNPYRYGFGQILEQASDGSTEYAALNVGLTKRMANHYQGQLSYSYSKAHLIGVNTGFATPSQAGVGVEVDSGPTLNDMRHRLSGAALVQLPFGIQASTIVVANTAPPFAIRAGADLDGDGTTSEDRPDGLALNAGGVKSEANLEIINAFRAVRGLSTVDLDQIGQRNHYVSADFRLTKFVNLGGNRHDRTHGRGVQPVRPGQFRRAQRHPHRADVPDAVEHVGSPGVAARRSFPVLGRCGSAGWSVVFAAGVAASQVAARQPVADTVIFEANVEARMRDGVILRADVYRPAGDALGIRCCCNARRIRSTPRSPTTTSASLARKGFVVIVQDTRGRYMSEGVARPHDEADDGFDTVAWARTLPYGNGKVGMFGGSYLATTQLLAATEAPDGLRGAVPGLVVQQPLRHGVPGRRLLSERWPGLESRADDGRAAPGVHAGRESGRRHRDDQGDVRGLPQPLAVARAAQDDGRARL